MLDAMRKRANSWFVRALLIVLIVSFAVWGIGDLFLGRADTTVAVRVGDIEVPLRDVERAFESDRQAFQRQFGAPLDRRQAASFGLLNRSLQNVVARALVDQHRRDLKIGVADAEVAAAIREDALFATGGSFDRFRFESFLRAAGLSEPQYVEQVRADIGRARILDTLTGLAATPAPLALRLGRHQGETRAGTVLEVTRASLVAAEPTAAELQAFLDAAPERFMAPESRALSLVTLTTDDIIDEIEIDRARLEAEYRARLDLYTTPERRRIGQLLAADRAVIEAAAAALAEGAVFADLATAMADRGLSYAPLGPTTERDLPPEFAGPIFALEPGAVSRPVESVFGWHLFRLLEVEPATVRSFAEVETELRRELALDQAIDQLPKLAAALDDGVAAGDSLEDAAAAVGAELRRFAAIDARGRDAAGRAIEGGAPEPAILGAVFAAAPGETSLLEETPDGTFYMFRVDTVTPPRPRRLDEVREQVAQLWRRDALDRAAGERLEAVMAAARAGRTLEALAAEAGAAVTLRSFAPLRRDADGAAAGLTPEAVAALFAAGRGELVRTPVPTAAGRAILRVDTIDVPDAAAAAAAVAQELDAAIRNDILLAYEAALRERYPVEVNAAAIASLFPADEP